MENRDVSIIGFESAGPFFESTAIDLLTQRIRSEGLSLSTYICSPKAAEAERDDDGKAISHTDSLNVINVDGYLKKMLHSTSELKGIPSDLLIILCHGIKRNQFGSSMLEFRDIESDRSFDNNVCVSAGSMFSQQFNSYKNIITLQELTRKTKLVLLMCCTGDQIMQDYLLDVRTYSRPDFLISNREFLNCVSCEVILMMIFGLIPFKNGSGSWNSDLVRDAIIRLFQIVKLFGQDYMGFWEYLKSIGLISLNNQMEINQQLSKSSINEKRVRTYGRYSNWELLDDFPEVLFMDFQSLLLVSKEGNQSKDTVKDIQLSRDTNVDKYLKNYKKRLEGKPWPTPPPEEQNRLARPNIMDDENVDACTVQSRAPNTHVLEMQVKMENSDNLRSMRVILDSVFDRKKY